MTNISNLCEYLKSHPVLNCVSLLAESEEPNLKDDKCEELKSILENCFARVELGDSETRFHDVYKPLRSFVFQGANQDTVIFGDSSDSKKCAFCGDTEPNASFDTIAHLLPQLTGRRELTTVEECDVCNSRMGRQYEPHLASLLIDNRAINCMKSSSRGTVKLQPRGSKCSIGGQACGEPLEIVLSDDDDGIRLDKWEENSIRLVYTRPGYCPQKASKSIAKSVYLTIPKEQRSEYEPLRTWIDNPLANAESTFVHVFVTGPALSITVFGVWNVRDSETDYAPLVAMFGHGNVIILWSYPNFNTNNYKVIYPHVPRPMYEGLELIAKSVTSIDSSRLAEVENSIEFHYSCGVLTQELLSANSTISVESDSEKYIFSADCTLTPESDHVTRIDLSNGDIVGHLTFQIKSASEIDIGFTIGNADPVRDHLIPTFDILRCIQKGAKVRIQNTVSTIPFDNLMDATIAPCEKPVLNEGISMFWKLIMLVEDTYSVRFDTATLDDHQLKEIVLVGELLRSGKSSCHLANENETELFTLPKSLAKIAPKEQGDDCISIVSYRGNYTREIQGVRFDIPVIYEFHAISIYNSEENDSMINIKFKRWNVIKIHD